MASPFDKNKPDGQRGKTPYELIEKEVKHLRKGQSTRHAKHTPSRTAMWLVTLAIAGVAWLWMMDPFIFAWYKGDAKQAYLYLHNYGTGTLEQQLADCGILTADEVQTLKGKQGSFQDYYATPAAANKQAEEIIHYMEKVKNLHAGAYEKLGPVGKLRYILFVRWGIPLPMQWDTLNPTVQ